MSEERDCSGRIAAAVRWITDHLEEFDPFRGGRPFAIKNGQRVGELAILVHSMTAVAGDTASPAVHRMIELLERVQRSHEFRDRLLRSPAEFILFAEVYACLRQLGRDDSEQRELIQRVLDAGLLEHIERLPHRMMDVASCLEWGGFAYPWPSLMDLHAASILGRVPSALHLDEDGTYALTHVLLFLYGFGIREGTSIPAADRTALARTLSMLLVSCAQEHHWDLLGELLLCWECLGWAPTRISERAWQAFLSVQKPDGAFPGPEWAEKRHDVQSGTLTAEERREIYFSHHYHTTLVGILAGNLRLRRARGQSALPAAGRRAETDLPSRSLLHPPLDAARVAAFDRARVWLRRLLEEGPAQGPEPFPEALGKILLGSWICSSATATAETDFAALAERVGKSLARHEQGGSDGSMPSTLALLTAALLTAQGVFLPSLHSADGYLARTTAVLGTLPKQEEGLEAALCEKRLLLHSLGLHPAPCAVVDARGAALVRDIPFADAASRIDELLLRISAWTLCGTRPVVLAPEEAWIGELLSGLAVHFLRRYDLATGSRVLRALAHLGLARHPATQDCLRFLLLHQRPEGAFGFFGLEAGRLKAAGHEAFSADLDLSLLVTVECLWALAETDACGWRLHASLPSPSRAAVLG